MEKHLCDMSRHTVRCADASFAGAVDVVLAPAGAALGAAEEVRVGAACVVAAGAGRLGGSSAASAVKDAALKTRTTGTADMNRFILATRLCSKSYSGYAQAK
jgi:hypothetical protein